MSCPDDHLMCFRIANRPIIEHLLHASHLGIRLHLHTQYDRVLQSQKQSMCAKSLLSCGIWREAVIGHVNTWHNATTTPSDSTVVIKAWKCESPTLDNGICVEIVLVTCTKSSELGIPYLLHKQKNSSTLSFLIQCNCDIGVFQGMLNENICLPVFKAIEGPKPCTLQQFIWALISKE